MWQYIVGVAAHLEYLAVSVLWIEAGKPCPFPEYEERLTLGKAAERLGPKHLFDATTVKTLRSVAGLRNSVTHRKAMYGVTVRSVNPKLARGVYEGGHVFSDLGALRMLVRDADAAITAMGDWLRPRRKTR